MTPWGIRRTTPKGNSKVGFLQPEPPSVIIVSRVHRGPALGRTGLVSEETIMLTGNQLLPRLARTPWNKGRLIGQKRPLKPKDVWAIRGRLQLEQRKRDLALFNLAIDSKLRGCDLVRLRVNDVCVGGQIRDRATVIQQKTGRPVQFEITELRMRSTRLSVRLTASQTPPGSAPRSIPGSTWSARFTRPPPSSARVSARSQSPRECLPQCAGARRSSRNNGRRGFSKSDVLSQ